MSVRNERNEFSYFLYHMYTTAVLSVQ